MDKYVKAENLRHYRRLLEQTTDENARRRHMKLLADEAARDTLQAPHEREQKYR